MHFFILILCLFVGHAKLSGQSANESPLLIQYSDNCNIGLIDPSGKQLLPTTYRYIQQQPLGNNWLISAETSTEQHYFLYKEGLLRKLNYPMVSKLNDRWLVVGKKQQYGIIDTEGNGIALMQYQQLQPINNSMVLSRNKKGYGIIDDNGKIIIKNESQHIICWEGRGFWLKQNNQYGWVNEQGLPTKLPQYDSVKTSIFDRCAIKTNNKWGLIDREGTLLEKVSYDDIEIFENGLIAFRTADKWQLKNLQGSLVSPLKFDNISNIGQLLIARLNDKAMLLNQHGKDVLPKAYSYIEALNKRCLLISKNDSYFFYDLKKASISNNNYQNIKATAIDSILLYEKDSLWGITHCSEQIVLKASYAQIKPTAFGKLQVVTNQNLLGIIDHEGQIIIPAQYKVIYDQEHTFKVRKSDAEWFFLSLNNQRIDCDKY